MQALNPYLPSWEYTPDGEPHVFGDRLYVYGSHDRFQGHVYCLNDYVCWSAPVDNLADWRYEGVIYGKTDDPLNRDGRQCLYAPDVTQGYDGRYYLYYVLDRESCVSVAVCDEPAGRYAFLGYVHYADGTKLGEREGDDPQFDPAVLTEDGVTYLYTGFCHRRGDGRKGSMVIVLEPDMLTVRTAPRYLIPGIQTGAGTGFEGHEFFEASSIRKLDGLYYFVYSSIVCHELCYATSRYPDRDFRYRGVIVSNNDLHIATYKPAEMPAYYGGNNHGGLVRIGSKDYIFYHRHTNGTNFCRQGLAERVSIAQDGTISQVEMTSCGLNDGPLKGEGTYPAYIACNLFTEHENAFTGGSGNNGFWLDGIYPRITQDGRDGDEENGYIMNLRDGATCGFKYFNCKGVKQITLSVRGFAKGHFEVKTAWDGEALAVLPVVYTDEWTDYTARCSIPDGVQAIYLTYRGDGSASLRAFTLAC